MLQAHMATFGKHNLRTFWLQSCRPSAKGTEVGNGGTDSAPASPSAGKKLKFEEEVKSDVNDVKQCLQCLKVQCLEDEVKHEFGCSYH